MLNTWLRHLVDLPYRARLSIVIIFSIITLAAFTTLHQASFGTLVGIPVALAAWLFRQRGGLICIAFTTPVMFIANTFIVGSFHWPPSMLIGFVTGMLTLIIETFLIGYLRNALDLTTVAREQMSLAYEQQRQLNQLKDQFILNVSHELRTPLTEIHGYLELLHEYDGQLDPEMHRTFVANAVRGCEELEGLVGNVLDTIQLGKSEKPPHLEELVAADMVRDVLEHFDPRRIREHPIHIDVPPELTVWAEYLPVRQIVRNLLANTFKYSDQGTPISIQAVLLADTAGTTAGAEPRRQVCISVQDAGPGIPPAEIPLLFGRFVRLKRDLFGPVCGSGLGLYICKQLVESMDGTIWVESSGIAGEGSRFCFTLPCGNTAGASVEHKACPRTHLAAPAIRANTNNSHENEMVASPASSTIYLPLPTDM